jgi:hypothetical protein
MLRIYLVNIIYEQNRWVAMKILFHNIDLVWQMQLMIKRLNIRVECEGNV